MKVHPACLILLLSFSIIACSKSSTDQRQQEKKCLIDSSVIKRAGGVNIKTVLIYDAQDRWIEARRFDNFNLTGHTEYKYGNDGKTTTIIAFTSTGAKSEEKQFTYNTQGKVAGYTLVTYAPYSTPVKKVDYVYAQNSLTLVGSGDAGILYEQKRYYENGNEVRGEYWRNGLLISVDTIEYGQQINKNQFDENISLTHSGTYPTKNLQSRRKTYDKINNNYTTDDSYNFELNADGYIIKSTSITNMPVPNPVPLVTTITYRCD